MRRKSDMRFLLFTMLLIVVTPSPGVAADPFIRPKKQGDPLIYGVKDGIVVTVHPFALDQRKNGGPRGILRVGYEQNGRYYLINYLSMEPIVNGKRGYSELEIFRDGKRGIPFQITNSVDQKPNKNIDLPPGKIEDSENGRVLSFAVHTEKFACGGRLIVEASLFEQHPQRVRFRTYIAPDSCPIDECVLSATMGNQSRCRSLWLKNEPVVSRELYSEYTGRKFVQHEPYGIDRLHRTNSGDVVAAISPDESEPREVFPFPPEFWGEQWGQAWHHSGRWTAQFWLKPKGSFDGSLQCRVNGRRTYWGSQRAIPGGVSYENFEFRETFKPGREIWFGYTTESPKKHFGFRYDATPSSERRKISAEEGTQIDQAAKQNRTLTNGSFSDRFEGWRPDEGAKDFKFVKTLKDLTALTTRGDQKETDQGRMYQCFRVPEDAAVLRFYLSGGCDAKRLYVGLWDGHSLWRRMTAANDNMPFEVRWDLKPLRGRTVTLEIVDRKDGPWGFLNTAGFEILTDSK